MVECLTSAPETCYESGVQYIGPTCAPPSSSSPPPRYNVCGECRRPQLQCVCGRSGSNASGTALVRASRKPSTANYASSPASVRAQRPAAPVRAQRPAAPVQAQHHVAPVRAQRPAASSGATGRKLLRGDADEEADALARKRCCTGVTELEPLEGDRPCGGTSGVGAGHTVGSPACSAFASEYAGPCTESITLFLNAPRTADGFLEGTTLGTVGIPDILAYGSKLFPDLQAESLSFTANARECREKCDNHMACAGAVVSTVDSTATRSVFCWMVLNTNPTSTPLDYRVARAPAARAAWIKPAWDAPPGAERLPTCLSQVCVSEPAMDRGLAERWRKTGPWAFCLAAAARACVGRLVASPWCVDYCAQPYADCDAALQDHCGKLYVSDPTKAVQGDMCPCFLPTKFYETLFTDLARELGLAPESKQPPCVYARCAANATYRPYAHKTGSLRCPDVGGCAGSITVNNEGRIAKVDARSYVRCFNDASGIATPGDDDKDGGASPKPLPPPGPPLPTPDVKPTPSKPDIDDDDRGGSHTDKDTGGGGGGGGGGGEDIRPTPKPDTDADTDADTDVDEGGADTDEDGLRPDGNTDADDDEKGLSRNTKLLLLGAAAALLLFLYARDRRKKEEAQAAAAAAAAAAATSPQLYLPRAPPQYPRYPPQTPYPPRSRGPPPPPPVQSR